MPPKIYHLHPLVAGQLDQLVQSFDRICALGFDHVCTAPPFAPGESGDIFVTADHERLHPALGWDGSADEGLSRLAAAAGKHGLRLMLDITLDEVAGDALIRQRQPDWFSSRFSGGPPDPRRGPQRLGVGHARFGDPQAAEDADRLVVGPAAAPAGRRHRRIPLPGAAPGAAGGLAADHPGGARGQGRMPDAGLDTGRGPRAHWANWPGWASTGSAPPPRGGTAATPGCWRRSRCCGPIAPALAAPEPSFADRLADAAAAGYRPADRLSPRHAPLRRGGRRLVHADGLRVRCPHRLRRRARHARPIWTRARDGRRRPISAETWPRPMR